MLNLQNLELELDKKMRFELELDEKLRLYKEEERSCRELGNKEGLGYSLINQSTMLVLMGRPQEALPLAEEAYQLATQLDSVGLARRSKRGLEAVRSMIRDSKKGVVGGRGRELLRIMFYSIAGIGLITLGIICIQTLGWYWFLGIIPIVLGGLWLAVMLLIATRTFGFCECPKCKQAAMVWRGRIKCDKCENDESSS